MRDEAKRGQDKRKGTRNKASMQEQEKRIRNNKEKEIVTQE